MLMELLIYVKDSEAKGELLDLAIQTVQNSELLAQLRTNIAKFAHHNSADIIAKEVHKLAETHHG